MRPIRAMFSAVAGLFSTPAAKPEIDKQAIMAEILEWLEPRVNDYYASFIAEAQLHEKLEAADFTFDEFRAFVAAKNEEESRS